MADRGPRLSDLSPAQFLARAAEFRSMAATASTADTMAALLELAERAKAIPGSDNSGLS